MRTQGGATATAGDGGAPRGVAVVGATGSIGQQALDVIARQPGRLRAVALAADSRWEVLCQAALACGAEAIALRHPAAAAAARRALLGSGIAVHEGADGIDAVAAWPGAAVSLIAAAGVAGLRPTLAAIRAGRDVALANKESLVSAGALVVGAAVQAGVRLIPVDGEHCAVFQCLQGRGPAAVARLWLTASGGPFRRWPAAALAAATPAAALAHPTWRMGPRITVDSATLMNKGFEVLEAAWLFGVDLAAIGVVVHPQSIVHALVQFTDGALLAQCSTPDMRLAIGFALAYPERWAQRAVPTLDPCSLGRLEFEPPDPARFPCLGLARAAGEAGGLCPTALNAADEVAVGRFLAGEISFTDIAHLVSAALEGCPAGTADSLEAVLEADAATRRLARAWRPAAVGHPAPVAAAGEGAMP